MTTLTVLLGIAVIAALYLFAWALGRAASDSEGW